ncbi:MAG TPA: rod shape-determining protein RodA [Actinocrinis sp.]|uniref:rod shape-determining protein RodA n=1 Tax=Actinocrinis sp. TaxID=1920516 RepID=UPI002DDD398D|nr:rod shape-determining protein RodA [Actinocrinis sp.]HEV2346630.1 rod shape-determining protein RodA [Actinocrinis sp.]
MIIGEKVGVPAIGVALPDTPSGRVRAAVRRGGAVRRFDWPLIGSAVTLALIGALLVWSATRTRSALTGGDPQYFLKRHLLNLAVGGVLATVVSALDHKRLRAMTPVIYLFALLGLLAVLSPLGSTVNGARSWIELGAGFSIQPAEFAKVGVVMAVAMTLAARAPVRRAPDLLAPVFDARRGGDVPAGRQLAFALLATAVPVGFIALLPDLGTTMVIVLTVVGMVVVSGVRLRSMAALAALSAAGAGVIVKFHLLATHQVNRFAAFADPNLDPRGVGYNTLQARLAIGSGGVLGQGLFHGAQTNGRFVPEQQTDFVFTVAGEELGLVGGLLIIALFGVLLWRACAITRAATEPFPLLLAAGVLCWFTFQMFENIGMTLGIMPVAGIPLPFVSYGGSSMFANFIAVGLLENVRLRSTR